MFIASAMAKIVLSALFASIMSFVVRVAYFRMHMNDQKLTKAQAN